MKKLAPLISIVIPCYNEASNVDSFYTVLKKVTSKDAAHRFELIYVNDGSTDGTLELLQKLADHDEDTKILSLSRNFGKEITTTAGIHQTHGDAVIMIDADGQHPAELIPEFIRKWDNGAQVVTGIRQTNQKEGLVKRYGSKLFYTLLNRLTGTQIIPGSSDFRLIDRAVRDEFVRMTERNRITRGLIDWIGFKQEYVYFQANARLAGEATYSYPKLVRLALNSFVSLSLKPLYFAFYAGLIILPLSILLGVFSVIETLIGDPLHLNISGTAYLVILVLFLLGLVLISQGITALYLSHIHSETQNRPLFVVDARNSKL